MVNWKTVVFDEGDSICTTSTPTGTKVLPLFAADMSNQYFCINALARTDFEPIQDWHSSDTPRRADVNVTKLRSILVEFDERELIDQVNYVQGSEMPYSVLTFSGGKSFHFIISLEQPVDTLTEYRQLVDRVYSALGGKAEGLDESTKNPSRLSRTPDAIRQPSGVVQALVDVRARVPRVELESWLTSRGFSKQAADDRMEALRAARKARESSQLPKWRQAMRGSTLNFLMSGADQGHWNISCFKAVCDLVRCGYTEDEIWTKMEVAHAPLDHSAVNTIRSAIRRAEYDKETGT